MVWWICLCGLLVAVIIILLIKITLMKKSAREIREMLAQKLSSDTNTLIDITSGDRDMRNLAESLNIQLRQLRQERHRFQQGDTELKEAVTNISHDLRTPLTAIFGYLDLLRRQPQSETMQQYLSMISNRAEVMKQLTEELFRYSVIVSVQETSMERLCLNTLLEESLASYYGAIQQRHITPEITMPEVRIERNLDKTAIMRVFGNILSNALKYSDGDLQICLTEDGKMTFSNHAKGLDTIVVGRLFDRFYTVESARNATGLGLSIAKLLTERMGGSIQASYQDEVLCLTIQFPGS